MIKWMTDKALAMAFYAGLLLLAYLVVFWVFGVDLVQKYNPTAVIWSGQTVANREIGWREDGVVVWRKNDETIHAVYTVNDHQK